MRSLWVLFLIKGIFSGAFFAFFPNWILQQGGGATDIATVWLVYYLIQIVLNLPTGHFSDLTSHKRLSFIGFALCVVSFLVSAMWGQGFLGVYIAVWGYAIGESFLSGSLQSWYQELLEQSKVLNVKNTIPRDQCERGGMILGALGVLPLLTKLEHPWWVFVSMFLVMMAICFRVPSTRNRSLPENELSFLNMFRVFGVKHFKVYFLSALFYGVASGLFTSLLWPRLNELSTLGISIGIIQALLSGARMVGQSVWAKSKWVEKEFTPIFSLFAAGVFMFVFSLMTSVGWATFAWVLFILMLSVHLPALDFQVLRLDQRFKASSFSAITIAMLVGASIGNLVILKLKTLELTDLAQISSACLVISAFSLFLKSGKMKALG